MEHKKNIVPFLEFAMVDAMTIDTLGYVKKLEAAGVDRRLAEAHAEAMNEKVLPLLATRLDITNLENKMENLFWKHTAAIVLTMITIGGFLVRFMK